MVAGLCRALLRDATEAEDATQQVFLSAHRSLLNGAEPREPAAWLATIARNECWARISGRMREPLPSDAADDVEGGGDPVAEAIRRADLAALWRAIRALPKQQREALLLREFGGLRYDELAAALAVTEPAVESLLFRARARLREQLQAAYASLAPLARVLVSGGAPAIATKAVALGLGAAAVTGTAVVAPTMLERHAHSTLPAPQARHVTPPATAAAPLAVAQAPTVASVVHHAARAARLPALRIPTHDGGGEHVTAAERQDAAPTHDGGRERGDASTTTTTTTQREHSDGGGDSSSSSSRESGDGGSGEQQQTTTDQTTTTDSSTATDPTTTVALPDLTMTTTTVDTSGDGSSGSDG